MSWVDRTRRSRRHGRGDTDTRIGGSDGAASAPSQPVPELSTNGNGTNSNGTGTYGNGTYGNGTYGTSGRNCSVSHHGPDGAVIDSVLGLGTCQWDEIESEGQPSLPFIDGPDFRPLTVHEADVVAVVAGDGRLVFISASAERVLGYDVSEAVGTDTFRFFDSESLDQVRSLFADLVARRRLSVSLELRTRRADGYQIDLELVASNHLNDPVGGVVVTLRDITARKRLEQRVHEVDRRQNALVESLVDGLIMLDGDGTIVRVNEAFEVLFRVPRVRILGQSFAELVDTGYDRRSEVFDESGYTLPVDGHPLLVALRRGRRVDGAVLGYRYGDRAARWVRVNAQAIVGPDGQVTGAVGTFSDITDIKRSAYGLYRDEEFLRVLLDTLDEGIVACDAQGRMTIFNRAARMLHGLDDDVEPIGQVPSSRMLRNPDGTDIDPEENPLLQAMSGQRLRNVEIVLAPPGGEQRKVSVNGQALVDRDGWKLGAVVAMHDVTEQKRNEERLADLAHHDPLTRLANRTLLATRMSEAVDSLRAHQSVGHGVRAVDPADPDRIVPEHPGVAVFLLDLDNFKEVNDDFGHDVGDDLLVAVARRLAALVRPSDTVARLGGDEFVVVCEIESGEEEMLRISRRISSALARPYSIDGRTLVAEASVGGVFVDDPDTDPSKLLSLADDAMYGVKWIGRRQRRSMTD
jgi:diguanylate cyclase (GGDEF)-like protein/PAS domain S-box-containing protein